MREVAILGVGMTKFGISEKTNLEMFTEAGIEALATSHIEPKDIEALFFGNCLGGFEEGQLHMAPFAHAELGLPLSAPATRFEAACATATVAIRHAALLVSAGVYDLVLAGGVERAAKMGTPLATRTFAMACQAQHEYGAGITFPGVFAMAAHMYASKYQIPMEEFKTHLANVAVKNHAHGSLNPKAHFQKEISVDTVLNSMMVADPLQLFDCCPFSDGAAAVVIAEKGKAIDLVEKPIYVAGMGQASAGPLYLQQDLIGNFLVVVKIEPEVIWRHQASGLCCALAERSQQHPVQQMGSSVVAGNIQPALGVDSRCGNSASLCQIGCFEIPITISNCIGGATDDQQHSKRGRQPEAQGQHRRIHSFQLGHGNDNRQYQSRGRDVGHRIGDQRAENRHADKQPQPAAALNQGEK